MAERRDLLVEIGTEELPPRAIRPMADALGSDLAARLSARGIDHGAVKTFATPRRVAALIAEVSAARPDREVQRRGPMVSAAFDADGKPTRAAEGFARSCDVSVEDLERITTDKGEQLLFRTTDVGDSTVSLLPGLLEETVARLPVPRRMRWADLDVEFSRPVHWAVLLFGDEAVQAKILGVTTGRMTQGHRFHRPQGIWLDSADSYSTILSDSGRVVADFEARREMVRVQVEDAARALGGSAVMEEDLLEETTALVEWPVAVTGRFDEAFLRLPDAVIMAPMMGHQRYFPVRGADGKLLPNFIAISNIQSTHPASVREGNERVLRPRLADAAFFYDADLKRPLQELQAGLAEVVYQDKLGTMAEKAARVSRLAGTVAIALGLGPEAVKLARRAGELSKCDLLTGMVGEFPELQGLMGREYATSAGEPPAVAEALGEAYLPRFAGDAIPSTDIGRAVALADKLDTLVGIFGIGHKPTGDKDPFALRRCALGVMRIVIEGQLYLNLGKLLSAAVEAYDERISGDGVATEVHEFMLERLRAYFAERGVTAEVFAAVLARSPSQPLDFARRVDAVQAFSEMPESASLAAANKRIQNILRQADGAFPAAAKDALFRDDAEWDLAAKLFGLTPRVQTMLKEGDYTGALTTLAGLREPVDTFLDQVKVMDDDAAVRGNRLALLNAIHDLFSATADISRL
jgi:glycyl-tRNA synthetase beta chain